MVNRSSHLSNLCSTTRVILSSNDKIRDVDEVLTRKNAKLHQWICVALDFHYDPPYLYPAVSRLLLFQSPESAYTLSIDHACC